MYTDTINKCAANAARINRFERSDKLGFWLSSAMAGAYVGLGIILIFTLGNLVDPSIRPLVMGATFGIALTLVIIAGSELFTGHTMFLTFGVKTGKITMTDLLRILPQTWAGNLLGSIAVALIYSYGGSLLAFIASGYEHSVANMTLFALSWFGAHSEAYTLGGIGHNLLWVTLGNTVSGALFMGLGYWYATPKADRPVAVTDANAAASQTQTA